MSTFLLMFLSVYAAMHLFLFLRVRVLFAGGATLALGLLMALMVAAPIAVRLFERGGWESVARFLAWPVYGWMGFIFLAFCGCVLAGGAEAIFRLSARVWPSLPAFPARAVTGAVLLAVTAISFYAALEARSPEVERLVVETEKLPDGVSRVRVAQISDVHLGLIVRKARLGKIARILAAETPDVLVSTGDLVDGDMNNLAGLAQLLRGMPARCEKFAVTGNHEFFAGLGQALAFTENGGFTVLRGARADACGAVSVVGTDDQAGGGEEPVETLKKARAEGRFVLYLKHRPAVSRETAGLFDLQLSGHTHGGQIFPFGFVTRRAYPLMDNTTRLPGGGLLHVSRGTGTWGPPMRLHAPPEITVIDIVRKAG